MCGFIVGLWSVATLLLLYPGSRGVNSLSLGGRIIGGDETTIEEFPYQVYISHHGGTHCGGSILNEYTILTAAHCIAPADKSALAIRVGMTNVHKSEGFTRKIAKTIVHKDWNDRTIQNDIAMIILAEPLPLSFSVKAIKLPELNQEFPIGSVAFVSGWGVVGPNKPTSTILKFAKVFLVEKSVCEKDYSRLTVTSKMLCAGRKDEVQPCNSDSGGPLAVFDSEGSPVLVGVVSFGSKCGDVGIPEVYTKVSAYRDWIDKHMIQ